MFIEFFDSEKWEYVAIRKAENHLMKLHRH